MEVQPSCSRRPQHLKNPVSWEDHQEQHQQWNGKELEPRGQSVCAEDGRDRDVTLGSQKTMSKS